MEFNLKKIFKDVFGNEVPPAFHIEPAQPRTETSNLGQPYYSGVEEDYFGREFFMPVHLNGLLVPFAVVGMTWKKTIEATPMVERGGSVHELINVDDYQFNIKGLMVDENDTFPEQQIIDLHKTFLVNASIRLESALTAIVLKGEPLVIIKEVKWPAATGVEHVRGFEIECESDMIFDLILK